MTVADSVGKNVGVYVGAAVRITVRTGATSVGVVQADKVSNNDIASNHTRTIPGFILNPP